MQDWIVHSSQCTCESWQLYQIIYIFREKDIWVNRCLVNCALFTVLNLLSCRTTWQRRGSIHIHPWLCLTFSEMTSKITIQLPWMLISLDAWEMEYMVKNLVVCRSFIDKPSASVVPKCRNFVQIFVTVSVYEPIDFSLGLHMASLNPLFILVKMSSTFRSVMKVHALEHNNLMNLIVFH